MLFDSLFGDLFDFDGNGKVSPDEEFFGFLMMDSILNDDLEDDDDDLSTDYLDDDDDDLSTDYLDDDDDDLSFDDLDDLDDFDF